MPLPWVFRRPLSRACYHLFDVCRRDSNKPGDSLGQSRLENVGNEVPRCEHGHDHDKYEGLEACVVICDHFSSSWLRLISKSKGGIGKITVLVSVWAVIERVVWKAENQH